jgi:Flp pilus assembly secretin CpaC
VTTSEAETTIMIKDGLTVIIGGLKKDQRSKSEKRIPLLGKIPILGMFFRNTSDELKKQELVILLTPHIMSGESPYTDFSEIKPKDGAVAKMVEDEIIVEKISSPKAKNESLQKEIRSPEDYRNFIRQKINRIASSYISNDASYSGSTQVSFVLYRSGYLKDKPKVVSSTSSILDKIAIRSIEEASPFPPFPQFLDKAEENFTIKFSSE